MAKSNLKTLNNNNVTQTANSSAFSKKSFTYNFYIFINLIQLSSVFFSHRYYYQYKFFNYTYFLKRFKFLLKKKNSYIFFNFNFFKNISINFFFLQSKYVVVLDYFTTKKKNRELLAHYSEKINDSFNEVTLIKDLF